MFSFFPLLVYENGNHSTYQDDDECDSSAAHPRKISLDEDILPTTLPVDEDDEEPGMIKWITNETKETFFFLLLIMSTRWTEGSSVWSVVYPMSIFLLLTVDLWRQKMRQNADTKKSSDPHCEQVTILSFSLVW